MRVECATQPWGVVQDRWGNAVSAEPFTFTATVFAAATGGATLTGAQLKTNADGEIPGFVEPGTYTITVRGEPKQVEAVSADDLAHKGQTNLFTAAQTFRIGVNPATGQSTSVGVEIEHGSGDSFMGLELRPATALEDQQAAPWYTNAFRLPYQGWQIKTNADGVETVWASGFDVGTGSRSTGPADIRNDKVLLYHYDRISGNDRDIFYASDEPWPALGVNDNKQGAANIGDPAAAAFFVSTDGATDGRAPLGLNVGVASHDGWYVPMRHMGSSLGGFWLDSSAPAGSKLKLGIGINTEPTEVLDVAGRARVHSLKLARGVYTDWQSNQLDPLIYAKGNNDLVLQARSETGGGVGDIFLTAGNASLVPLFTVHGAAKSVSIGADPGDLTGVTADGQYVFGLRNTPGAPTNTAAGNGRPVAAIAMWAQSSSLRVMEPSGSVVHIGNVGLASGSGVAFGAYGSNSADAKLGRIAAGVIETDSVFRFNAAGSWQTTVGAAGAASAVPLTPSKYLKVRDEAGTTYVIPAYAAS